MEVVANHTIEQAYQSAFEQELIETEDTLLVFLDLAVLDDRLQRLRTAFGPTFEHAVAVKANPLTFVLKHLVEKGFGLEAASLAEVFLAENAGIDCCKIVFDSPAKTVGEIQQLIKRFPGIRINADSLDELARYPKSDSGLKLGLRVNPLIASTTVKTMNVGGQKSKFGESIENRQQIVQAVLDFEDLDCLHLHIGSQYTDFSPTVTAIRRVVDLACEINDLAGQQKISTIDIGGGFPVNYRAGEPFMIEDYTSALKAGCPELFTGSFRVISEFGRYVHANACWAVSKIEYMKANGNLISHAGADMFLRECYNPNDWHHEMSILDSSGTLKHGDGSSVDIGGPLCFGGDIIARDAWLPQVDPGGDWLVIRDVGANTFSLWSRHCSRCFPKVLMVDSRIKTEVKVIKERESIDSIIQFWS